MTETDTKTGSRKGLALLVIATAQLMVVLDGTIVNVALPNLQGAMDFSGEGLEWVVNAYALAFGGLILLGGRAGDILGRRRVFMAGLGVFIVASLAGGFANDQWLLLTARALQGMGAAIVAPTSLALVSTTFAEGKERAQALGVVAAMGGLGATLGLLLGGVLTSYISWRWVFFVNVPIGLLALLAAPSVISESTRRRGRFDLVGAILGTAGITLLTYGLAEAAASRDGKTHWADTNVAGSLAASVVLLVAFALIEARSRNALMPLRVVADRSRAGSYLIGLCVGCSIAGVFFFLTLIVQTVWGYSAVKTGMAYLPMSLAITAAAIGGEALVARFGPRTILVAGGLLTAVGMTWVSRVGAEPAYVTEMLGPTLLSGFGLGLIFTPMTIVGVSRIHEREMGVASSLEHAGRQVGGAIGLAVLGTLAWTKVVHDERAGQAAGSALSETVRNEALVSGFSRGFLAAGLVMLLAAGIAAVSIVLKRDEIPPPPGEAVPDGAVSAV
ncbi:MFS transporter [Actinomadura sp. 9N215]|uniref:MFS transporter n=1 Tax=Actinomadura sp. 9N215 TaxID=3375150 RepID=UPI0037B80227